MRFQEALSNTQAELELKELDKQPEPHVSICEEADIITKGSRNLAYGAPSDDFKRISKLWSVILATEVSAENVGMCMIALKMSRELHRSSRMNRVDIAGYASTLQMMAESKSTSKETP